jgi:hypothetical protein
MSSSVQRPLSNSQSRIENTSLGVPNSESLFADQQPWRADLEDRGWTTNGKLTDVGRAHYNLAAPPTWIKIYGDGSIAIDPAFFLAPSIVENNDPNNPEQKRYNRLCQKLVLHDSVLCNGEGATADSATKNDIAQSRSNLRKKYDQYYTHLHDTHKPDPAREAGSIWKDEFDFRAAEVAEAAEQLSCFLLTKPALTNTTNAPHIRPGQTSPSHGAIVTTPPFQPLDIQTTSQSSGQSWEENCTPDELKFPTLPPVTSPARLPQPQAHSTKSVMAGPSETSTKSLVGDMQYPTEISKSEPGGSRGCISGQLSKLKAKFTQREQRAAC